MGPPIHPLNAKYEVTIKLEPFCTGGRVQVSIVSESLLCQCGDKLQVLDTKYGKTCQSLAHKEDEIVSFATGPDYLTLVSSHKSRLLIHCNWKDGIVVRTWNSLHFTPVVKIEFKPTTTLVASEATDGSLKVWDINRQYCTHYLNGGNGVYSVVQFHSDPKNPKICGAFMDGKIRCWHLSTSIILAYLEGHFSIKTEMTFFPSLNPAVSSRRDKVLMLWDLQNNTSLRIVPTYKGVKKIVPIPLGSLFPYLNVKDSSSPHVFSTGERGCLRVCNLITSTEVFKQNKLLVTPPDLEGAPTIAQLQYDHLYVVYFDHNIFVNTMKDLVLIKQYAGYNDDILNIAWYREGETHLAVPTNSTNVKVYDIETKNCTLLKGHTDLIMTVITSKENLKVLTTSSKHNSVRVWLMSQEPFKITCVTMANAHTGSVGSVAFSQAAISFLVSGSQDTCLIMWKLTPAQLEEETALTVLHTTIAHEKDINSVCVSLNDKLIATNSQDKLGKIWNGGDLQLLGVLRGHLRNLWALQFSPADKILACSSTDGTIKLWNFTDYSCLKTLEGHESSVLRIHFVAKTFQRVSAASDGLIRRWTLKSSECVTTMDAHQARVWALAVKNQDTVLASGAGDSTLILWKNVTKKERKEQAQENEKRILEEQQLVNFIQQTFLFETLRLAIRLARSLNILKDLMNQGERVMTDLERWSPLCRLATMTKLRT